MATFMRTGLIDWQGADGDVRSKSPVVIFAVRRKVTSWRTGASAFSLVQLLVVVTILIVLLTLFIPVMKAVRERSARGICMGNLRQIGTAYYLYAGDNNGFFPRGGYPSYPCTFYSVSSAGVFVPGAYFLLSMGGYLSSGVEKGVVAPFPSEPIIDVFFCPSYVANYGQSKADIMYQQGGAGYVFWGAWPPDYGLYHSVQTIHDPPMRALLGDCVDVTVEQRNRSHLFGKNRAAGANWLFVDGHVEWVPVDKLTKSQNLAGETYLLPDTP